MFDTKKSGENQGKQISMAVQDKIGTIVAHYGVAVEVLFDDSGNREILRVKRNSGHVVGDRVKVNGEVLARQERQTELQRMDARGGLHVVGANLDHLYIVATCEPLPPPGFIDRAIVAARVAGLTPILILNKADLACFDAYRQATYPLYEHSLTIFIISAQTGKGLTTLIDHFHEGHRGIFVGPTGVGKSSILNGLIPDLELDTAEISETKKRGRHTTTVATLHQIDGGGELIDSPGFNDFGLVNITATQLATHFPGFEITGEQPCRFRDCKHRDEPGCTVAELVAGQHIQEDRYAAYLQILLEVEGMENEPKYRLHRHRRKKN
jgi:ribosome biogenesis GTPase